MIITSANSDNINVPGTIESYMSYENMNLDDFMLPGLPGQESSITPNYSYQQVASGSTTPQCIPSPVPSGGSTPGMHPGNNISTPFSPANYSTNSPRMSQSPMIGLPITSPHHSRPASTNSSMGFQQVSPHHQPMASPQVTSYHQSSMAHLVVGDQDSPMTSPVAVQHQVSYSSPGVMPTVAQPQPMAASEIPSPVNRVSSQRSPIVCMQSRAPMRPAMEKLHSVPAPKQMPVIRGMPPLRHVSVPRMVPSKSPSYKIFELNKRLQERHPQNESTWWDYFACEFFDDSAILSLTMCQEDGSRNFNIKRALIPNFFKSFFEGGAVELFFNLRHTKEWLQNTSIMVESEQCAMETLYINPIYTKVISEGRMILEFVPDDMMRIKSWHYTARGWQEQIPRTVLSIQAQQPNPGLMQQWSMNITRQGFPTTTLNFLRMCCILQPMQQLMTMHKSSGIDPRECLKKTLVQNWRGSDEPIIPVMSRDVGRPAPKQRKKRKNAAEKTGPTNPRKKRLQEVVSVLPPADQAEVMVVGEPSMMGGSLGKDDERHITRIENMQLALESIGHDVGGMSANTSWTLDDVLASTLPDFDGNHQN